jgi:hypothetical protein
VLNNATSRALDANIEQEKECIVCVDTIVYGYVSTKAEAVAGEERKILRRRWRLTSQEASERHNSGSEIRKPFEDVKDGERKRRKEDVIPCYWCISDRVRSRIARKHNSLRWNTANAI